jgi:hypothetical protein
LGGVRRYNMERKTWRREGERGREGRKCGEQEKGSLNLRVL